MKFSTLAQQTLLALGISSLVGVGLTAKTIDVSKSQKDIRVMSKIIETSLESSDKDFPGTPRISGTYLAKQGYLFTIQLNGLGSFGIPGLASWDGGRLELDIPEIISNALESVELEEWGEDVPKIFQPPERPERNNELQESLRNIREQQRESRRTLYKLQRELRHVEEEKERAKLESELAAMDAELKKYETEYSQSLNSYKVERNLKRAERSKDAIDAIFETVCDYGQSLRALKSSEWVTLMVKGGTDKEGKRVDLVYVMDQKSIKNCSDAKKLQAQATHYKV